MIPTTTKATTTAVTSSPVEEARTAETASCEITRSFEMTPEGKTMADELTTSPGRTVESTMNAETTAAAASTKITSAAGSTVQDVAMPAYDERRQGPRDHGRGNYDDRRDK